MVLLSIFIAVSAAIQMVENIFFPSSLPIRPGLANLIIIIVLMKYGIGEGLLVTAARTLLASLLTGKFLGIPFFLGLSGGIVSVIVMGILLPGNKNLGITGISILGSVSHNFTQLAVIYFFLIPNPGIFQMLPYIWLMSLLTGFLTGVLAEKVLNISIIKRINPKKIKKAY